MAVLDVVVFITGLGNPVGATGEGKQGSLAQDSEKISLLGSVVLTSSGSHEVFHSHCSHFCTK